ncbi:MAG: hypothetical protein DBY24_10375 [Prevotellaceae bacterium]|nr:MAG: hypothetical protein DBY24_10375 [Prevotellaceae bacterium]
MKTIKAFSNKVIDLADVQDYERITAEFNRLTKDYYTKEKNAIQQLRTLRQIRIRLSLAKKVYEVTGKETEYIIRLLKNEEEIVLTLISQACGLDMLPAGDRPVRLSWSGKLIDLVEIAYGLYVSRCINGGRCDIKEIIAGFEQLFGVRLPHIYNRLLAIRNRKNGRTPFLKWLCEQIERDADLKDE